MEAFKLRVLYHLTPNGIWIVLCASSSLSSALNSTFAYWSPPDQDRVLRKAEYVEVCYHGTGCKPVGVRDHEQSFPKTRESSDPSITCTFQLNTYKVEKDYMKSRTGDSETKVTALYTAPPQYYDR